MDILNTISLILLIISATISIFFMVLGIHEYLVGPKEFEQLLKKHKIPLSYKRFLIIGFASIIMTFVLFMFREFLISKL